MVRMPSIYCGCCHLTSSALLVKKSFLSHRFRDVLINLLLLSVFFPCRTANVALDGAAVSSFGDTPVFFFLFLTTLVTSEQHGWILPVCWEPPTWALTEALTGSQQTGRTSSKAPRRSDGNTHVLHCNTSTPLICSSVQFIIFILADD